MSPTRRGFFIGSAALLAAGRLAPAMAVAMSADDQEEVAYLASPEHKAWEAENARQEAEWPLMYRPAVKEAKFRMEIAIEVLDSDGRQLDCVPVERTGAITLFADGSARFAVWGPEDWRGLKDIAKWGNLTPEIHFTETLIDAETFAPMRVAIFDTVDVGGPLICPSAVASDWTRRRNARIW